MSMKESTKESIKQAERLVAQMCPVYLATNGDGGFPNVRAMSPTRSDGLATLWFLTGADNDKYGELSKDSRCMVYATDPEDTDAYLELRLRGTMEILKDAESRAFAWTTDEYLHYFPGGKDDPNLRVLKFTAKSGSVQTIDSKENFEL